MERSFSIFKLAQDHAAISRELPERFSFIFSLNKTPDRAAIYVALR